MPNLFKLFHVLISKTGGFTSLIYQFILVEKENHINPMFLLQDIKQSFYYGCSTPLTGIDKDGNLPQGVD